MTDSLSDRIYYETAYGDFVLVSDFKEKLQEFKGEILDKWFKDLDYLYDKINWSESFLDAKAVEIMNEQKKTFFEILKKVMGDKLIK